MAGAKYGARCNGCRQRSAPTGIEPISKSCGVGLTAHDHQWQPHGRRPPPRPGRDRGDVRYPRVAFVHRRQRTHFTRGDSPATLRVWWLRYGGIILTLEWLCIRRRRVPVVCLRRTCQSCCAPSGLWMSGVSVLQGVALGW